MSGFNATPLDGSTAPIPMSSAVVPGDATPHPIQGTRTITDSNGNVLSDVAVSVLNGNPNGQNTMVNSAPVVLASNQTAVPVSQGAGGSTWYTAPTTSGNITAPNDFHLVSAATNNATNIKASGGIVYGYEIFNASAAMRYVKLYNKATAPAPATDTPIRTIGIPAGARASFHSAVGLGVPGGAGAYNLGIGIAIVTGIADNNNTAGAAADVVVDIDWI